jgi:hypothetical protein
VCFDLSLIFGELEDIIKKTLLLLITHYNTDKVKTKKKSRRSQHSKLFFVRCEAQKTTAKRITKKPFFQQLRYAFQLFTSITIESWIALAQTSSTPIFSSFFEDSTTKHFLAGSGTFFSYSFSAPASSKNREKNFNEKISHKLFSPSFYSTSVNNYETETPLSSILGKGSQHFFLLFSGL